MKGRAFLASLALVIAVPVLLVMAYMWQAGLDLGNPENTREWIKVCARSHEDLYCKAAAQVMKETNGPLVFLRPNKGDRDITADLTLWKRRPPTAAEVQAVARANLFPGSRLSEGTVTALDGQKHQVVCGLPDEEFACRINQLRFHAYNQPRSAADGTVYSVLDPNQQQDFFLPAQ